MWEFIFYMDNIYRETYEIKEPLPVYDQQSVGASSVNNMGQNMDKATEKQKHALWTYWGENSLPEKFHERVGNRTQNLLMTR